jgi:putative tricarboxylic transport membrane protein
MKIGEIVSGAVLAGLGIFIILEARGWDYLGPDGPGPGFFPLGYGILMLVLAIVLILNRALARAQSDAKPVVWAEIGRALSAWAALAICVGLLKLLGFLLAFGLFTFFLVFVMYRRPLPASLAVAVCVPTGFYLLFPLALNVGLPLGVLGF